MSQNTVETRPALSAAADVRRARRGGALIIALCATIPLIIAGGTLLVTVTQGRRATETSVALAQARDASASGAQDALARLADDPNYTGSYQLQLGGPAANVTVTAWADDGVDNDGNGLTDDGAEEEFVEIVSTGTTNVASDAFGLEIDRATRHARSVTEAIVRKTNLDIAVDQAAYVDDPLAQFKFSGTQFLVSGIDFNLDNTPGPADPVAGIGTPGDPNWIIDQLKKTQYPCVTGDGGLPCVETVPEVDLAAQMTLLSSIASQVWEGPDDKYDGDIGDRTNLVPIIAHAKGNLALTGNTRGCGVLIVDGDLTVNGSFDFAGFIYVSGAVTFNGGGGDKDLHGGLFTLGAVNGPGNNLDVIFNGTVQIRYSSEALTTVQQQLAGSVALVSWTQR
jgi:hypothetical protein